MQRPNLRRATRGRHSRGQALIELALILPVLFLLFLATVDLGRFFYSQITVTNAAREGAMNAAEDPTSYVPGTCDAATSKVVCAAINEARNSFVTVAPADVDLTCPGGCAKSYGKEAIVTVTGHFRLLTPLMAMFTGGQDVAFTSTARANVIIVPEVAVTTSSTTTSETTTTTETTTTETTTTETTTTATPCTPAYAGFTYTQADKNADVVFASTSTPTTGDCAILYWRWDFGDGAVSAGNPTTISHKYNKKGQQYTVTLTVTVPGDPSITTSTFITIETLS